MENTEQTVIETLREDGIAILRNVLTSDEVEAVREDFDSANADLGKGSGEPGVRDRLVGEKLLAYPNLAALYSHPKIINVVSEMLNEPTPFLWMAITNRYNPEHVGVRKHSDAIKGTLSVPFTRQAMAVFLDDVDPESGSLTYVPGSHHRHFIDPDDPDRQAPTQDEIDAGDYVPTTVNAGDVVFRVPEVWHAVVPIYRLRRYVTGTYATRGEMSRALKQRVEEELDRRRNAGEYSVPEAVRPYWELEPR